MLLSFIAAAAITLDVPYLPQTDALCGGAAAAMVYRYWGDARADVTQFAPLVDRRAGGIVDAVLVNAVRERGWTAISFAGSLPLLRAKLAESQPVIVLVADGRSRYHFVVVIGAAPGRVVVHDPALGPSRSVPETEFLRRWQATGFWSLVVLPPDGFKRSAADEPASAPLEIAPPPTRCDALLGEAIASIRAGGLTAADRILEGVRAECPNSAGPVRELAGARFAQRRWADAAVLAREAVALEPADSYAWDVLGSSLFMQDDTLGALRAWNHIGRPTVHTVHIEGLRRTRYELVPDALHLKTGVLTPEAFKRAQRLLDDLPDRAAARIALRPERDGFAAIDVTLHERSPYPRGPVEWAAVSARTLLDREAAVSVPGPSGQGEIWSASWRWWEGRPRLAVSFAAPRGGRFPGLWRVDGSWEAQTYSLGPAPEQQRREERAHGSVTFGGWMTGAWRYAFTGGLDSWDSTRRDASLGASLERRFNRDRLSLVTDATRWMPLSGGRDFAALALRGHFRASPDTRGWDLRMTSGVERTSDSAPLALWSGAGEGRVRTALLRAHPLLGDGVIEAGNARSFGRTLVFGSAEVQRWLERPRLPRVGMAGFVDAARSSRRLNAGSASDVDVGTGVRVRVPGWNGALAVDVARGLRDGRTALTFGWQF